ncbi:MAG: cytosolic protein, partial [Symploca sp. SIO2G7]|nr:cytosolic protein [Symploca sp. SIO2G7]
MSKTSTDFDSPWKDTLEWYFEPFIRLCFPQIHSAIDWSRSCQFLDKELQKVVRDAQIGRRFADK